SGMVATLTVQAERVAASASQGFTLATDVAEWLVRRGGAVPGAHAISGALVQRREEGRRQPPDLAPGEVSGVDPALTPQVRAVLTVPGALRARSARGGTAPERVAEQLAALAETAHRHAAWAQRGSGGPARPGSDLPDPDLPDPDRLRVEQV